MKIKAIIVNGFINKLQECQLDQIASINAGKNIYLTYTNGIDISEENIQKFNALKKNECMNDEFEIKPDYSKETVYRKSNKQIVSLIKGVDIDSTLTIQKYEFEDDVFDEKLDKWVLGPERIKENKKLEIYKKYSDKMEKGVKFSGNYHTLDNRNVKDPVFQYDETSQNRLYKYKDIPEVNFWRSINNENIVLTVEQKNKLYTLLITEWANDFKNRLDEMEAL